MQTLSIIVPFFNESQSAAKIIELICQIEARSDVRFLLVDNGSTGDPLFERLSVKNYPTNIEFLRLEQNQGFGGGILAGIATCNTSHVCWMPGNLKVKPADAIYLWDVWVASGLTHGAVKASRRRVSKLDSLKTFGAGVLTSLVYGARLFDSGATPTLANREFMRRVSPHAPHGYDFELFVLQRMRKSGLRILRPKIAYGARVYGNSHWQTSLRSELLLLKQMLSHRLEWKQIEEQK